MKKFAKDIFKLTDDITNIIENAKSIVVPENREQLLQLAIGGGDFDKFEVSYDIPGNGNIVEATVTKCKNGLSVNYTDTYMRRRDPNCMVIGDSKITDKERYCDRFGEDFSNLRNTALNWLSNQDLIIMPFMVGDYNFGYEALLIAPANAGFFAGGLADLQGFIPKAKLRKGFQPTTLIYLAPPFRHTHFEGNQVVVHNRLDEMHEVFSFNLYPGPSAKKGIYGVLLNIGEMEGWTTLHASTVRVTTPYDNIVTIMHEGASGGGKSEMIEQMHREVDGTVVLAEDTVTGEEIHLSLNDTCNLSPVTDDMALSHPKLQKNSKKLVVKDAENGWFLRVDHITEYGTAPHYEKLCTHPPESLIFLNIDAAPNSSCLIWEHILDEPNKPCPNPRVIMPRNFVPGVVNDSVEIDIRSFGVRAPLCTKEVPSYGIIGLLHILPPALSWLWRLTAPRGHANPSILDTGGMSSEGVGSYWPFATGKMVNQANILLEQIISTPSTRHVLIPNQHIGAYKVGFTAQWVAREYLARKGSAKFRPEQLVNSECPLLGYSLKSLKINNTSIPRGLLQPNRQLEIGLEGYNTGAKMLVDFFKKELGKYLTNDLNPLGRQIIECCMSDGSIDEYVSLISMN